MDAKFHSGRLPLRESGWSEVRNRLIISNQTNLCARQTKDREELFDGSLSPWMAELWLSLRQRGVDDREGLEAASVPEGGRPAGRAPSHHRAGSPAVLFRADGNQLLQLPALP